MDDLPEIAIYFHYFASWYAPGHPNRAVRCALRTSVDLQPHQQPPASCNDFSASFLHRRATIVFTIAILQHSIHALSATSVSDPSNPLNPSYLPQTLSPPPRYALPSHPPSHPLPVLPSNVLPLQHCPTFLAPNRRLEPSRRSPCHPNRSFTKGKAQTNLQAQRRLR